MNGNSFACPEFPVWIRASVHHAIQNTERPCVISVHGRGGYFTLLQRIHFCDFWHWNIIIFLASREIGISSFKRCSGAEIFLEKLLRLRREWMEETTTCAAEMVFLFFCKAILDTLSFNVSKKW
jgi:hypothetical protein